MMKILNLSTQKHIRKLYLGVSRLKKQVFLPGQI